MDNRILLAAEELEALAQTLRSVSSGGEKTPSCPMTLTEWQDWVDQVQTDVLVLKQKVAALEKEWRDHREDHLAVVGSEPGPQSPLVEQPTVGGDCLLLVPGILTMRCKSCGASQDIGLVRLPTATMEDFRSTPSMPGDSEGT